MKLELSIPARPGFVHLLPGIDILALVLILPLMTSSFKSNAGIEITLPETVHRLAPLERHIQVSVTGVLNPKIWVNKQEVQEEDLLKVIAQEVERIEGKGAVAIALQVDAKVPSGVKQRIQEKLLLARYRVFDMGTPVK